MLFYTSLIILGLSQTYENLIFKVNMTWIYNCCLQTLHGSSIARDRIQTLGPGTCHSISTVSLSNHISWQSSCPTHFSNPLQLQQSSHLPCLWLAPCRIPHLADCLLCLECPYSPLCTLHPFLNSGSAPWLRPGQMLSLMRKHFWLSQAGLTMFSSVSRLRIFHIVSSMSVSCLLF